jgi:predicted nucleic acid-binding protein
VTLLVDTSVWSLALRRDAQTQEPEVQALIEALGGSDVVVTAGLVLQELLQGFNGPKAASAIVERFSALALVQPEREDYIAAAAIRNTCRRNGVQLGTVDALIAQLCIGNDLTLLTTDHDFSHAAKYCKLKVWSQKGPAKMNDRDDG